MKPTAPPMPPAASFADSTRVSAPSAMRSSPVAKTANAEAEEARIKDRAPLTVNYWIALIRRLRDEGKAVIGVRPEAAERVLAAVRAHPLGRAAALIGVAVAPLAGPVVLDTGFGRRLVPEPEGEPLPRIC